MRDLVEEIAYANEVEIEELLTAVLDRYAELFPNWEISTISLKKSSDRTEQLDRMIQLLQEMKTSP
ncbi:MAG: hypothetical protein E7470_03480 [Ruminococcaceae bacterium]|nr:hypothetical protein [Oscillospiraceae bacterium]